MIYVPIIYAKPAEMKFGAKSQTRLADPRTKPYIRIMADAQYNSPDTLLETLGLTESRPFIGIPRVTDPAIITASKSRLIRDLNYSEDSYLKAQKALINTNAIIVYDCNAKESEYEAFVGFFHDADKPIALYTDHPIDYSVLRAGDYLLFNLKQNLYAPEDLIDEVRSRTAASLVLIIENRALQITNKSLEDGDSIGADGTTIFGDIAKLIKNKQYKVEGFGDFCGWKNTINVKGGGGGQAVKTITLFDRMAWCFKVLKDSAELPLKIKIQNYMECRDPDDSLGTVALLNTCVKIGGHADFNVLSIYHYIEEMLLNDDWSSI